MYKLDNNRIIELPSNKPVFSAKTKEDRKRLKSIYNRLNQGSGFMGETPDFFLKR